MAYLARGCARRDSGRQGARTVRGKLEGVELGTPLGDLEPVGAAAVPGRDAAWGFTKVNGRWASVVKGVVKLEADAAACGDGDDLASRTRADVAADVVGVDTCNGAVVDWLADGSVGRTTGRVEGSPDI